MIFIKEDILHSITDSIGSIFDLTQKDVTNIKVYIRNENYNVNEMPYVYYKKIIFPDKIKKLIWTELYNYINSLDPIIKQNISITMADSI